MQRFNKELAEIDQVIIGGETIRAFVRALGPKGFALYDSLSVILVNIVEEIAVQGKPYNNLKIINKGRKLPKEAKKEYQ